MADFSRIEDLRRRVQKDPASIAFAQLAEECRRAGNLEEAVTVARAGLALHPTYLSARVTLGRTLLELNQLDDARTELQQVLRSAPENLAALRALADTLRRLGDSASALTQYRAALALAKNDPDLQDIVAALEYETSSAVVPEPVAEPAATFSYAELEPFAPEPAVAAPGAFSYADPDPIDLAPPAPAPTAFSYADAEPEPPAGSLKAVEPEAPIDDISDDAAPETSVPDPTLTLPDDFFIRQPEEESSVFSPESAAAESPAEAGHYIEAPEAVAFEASPEPEVVDHVAESIGEDEFGYAATSIDPSRDRAVRTLVVLEQWLQAVHVSRADRHA